MRERLLQLLDLEQLTPSKFADLIGVQRSSVSHVLSGRNNPSYDFLQKTLKAFPGLRADWIMLGTGAMYEQMGRSGAGDLFDAAIPDNVDQDRASVGEDTANGADETEMLGFETVDKEDDTSEARLTEEESADPAVGGQRRVVQVMVFYDDDTFTSYRPNH